MTRTLENSIGIFVDIGGSVLPATPAPKQKRGPSMARRSGQTGRIEKKGNAFYCRFWIDDLDTGKRKYACVRICPATGPGALNLSERKRRCMDIIAASGANSPEICRAAKGAFLGTTFHQQSSAWLAILQTRKRRPVRPHTLNSWESALNYINAKVGSVTLEDFKNSQLKDFISGMVLEMKGDQPRFAPKSVSNYIYVIKSVIASAIDSDGECLYPRKWNKNFLDCPTVKDQNAPSFTALEVEAILARAEEHWMLYALLAGTGMRVGEAFALQIEDLAGNVIHVRHNLWNGRLGPPKTDAGLRDIDMPASLAAALTQHVAGRTSGYVFQNELGGALNQSNVLGRSLHPILKALGLAARGFHSFRRWRVTHLRKQRVPEDLLMFWIGHEPRSVTDGYSRLKDDTEYRQLVAEEAGLGFVLEPELHELNENAVTVTC